MLLILHPYKFTLMHKQRMELELLKKEINTKIEIHDLGEILNKEVGKMFLTKEEKKVKKFKSIIKWINYFKNIKKKENLTVLNFLSPDSLKSLLIHFFLYKSNIKIIKMYSAGEFYRGKDHKEKYDFEVVKKKIEIIYNDPSKLILFIKIKIYNFIYGLLNFKNNIILHVGNQKKNSFPKKNDKYFAYHGFDYSNYLINKKKKLKYKKFIIYIDCSGPFYSFDEKVYGLNNYKKIQIKKWYYELNKFFEELETLFKSKLLIIPHAKNKGKKNPYYNKKFKVVHDLDAINKLTPSSKVVVAHACPSTGINYAIANKKKLILTYNHDIKKFMRDRFIDTKIVAKALDVPVINLSKPIRENDLLKPVNKKKYNSYLYKYVTSKKISNKTNHQILGEIVNNV